MDNQEVKGKKQMAKGFEVFDSLSHCQEIGADLERSLLPTNINWIVLGLNPWYRH